MFQTTVSCMPILTTVLLTILLRSETIMPLLLYVCYHVTLHSILKNKRNISTVHKKKKTKNITVLLISQTYFHASTTIMLCSVLKKKRNVNTV